GAGEQRCWHVEAERLGGFHVDDKFVFGRRLHWQVGRLLALEDTIDVGCRPPELVDGVRSIGDQAAGANEETEGIDSRQSVAGGERDDEIAMNRPWWSSNDNQTTVQPPRQRQGGAADVAWTGHLERWEPAPR